MRLTVAVVLLMLGAAAFASEAAAQSAHAQYTSTLARERGLRDARRKPTLKQLHGVVAAYERLVRRQPRSGYSDNALWQAANLSQLAFEQYGQGSDKRAAVRLLRQLRASYPSSSLAPRAAELLARIEAPVAAALPRPARPVVATAKVDLPPPALPVPEPESAAPPETRDPRRVVTIRSIKRTPLPDGVRVTIEMDDEAIYRHERLENPARVFFDVRGARTVASLADATLRFSDHVVREIRLGRHPQQTTRVVMDMKGVDSYSVFTLYNPFRLVVDFRRPSPAPPSVPALPESGALTPPPSAEATTGATPPAAPPSSPLAGVRTDGDTSAEHAPARPEPPVAPAIEKLPIASRALPPASLPPALPPSANSDGRFSLARQLGLGISRIVIDPGHGGHDPGARGNGQTEAELVLDVALRLKKLLEKETAVEVAMTRESDVFIPLEERTAFANRQGADLFLSIHANASVNSRARGVETYYLNFASNPEAEAVAARENSASARTMHNLPDIVRAIALNNKIDESRDFASMVQRSMVRRLASRNRQLRDLGVKQAPFVVLIGAGMPSVLAEISFITNRQEGQLLKTGAYRQQIAEALMDAVMRYQQSLKNARKVASREP